MDYKDRYKQLLEMTQADALVRARQEDRIHSLEDQVSELKKDVKYWKTLHINGNEFIKKLEQAEKELADHKSKLSDKEFQRLAAVDCNRGLAKELDNEKATVRLLEENIDGRDQVISDLSSQNARLKEALGQIMCGTHSSFPIEYKDLCKAMMTIAADALQQLPNQGDAK